MRITSYFTAGNVARLAALAAAMAFMAPAQGRAQALNLCTDTGLAGLDPVLHATAPALKLGARQIFDRLVETSPGGTSVQPSLALWWDISKDGLQYTFKLRRGVRFQTVGPFVPTRDLAPEDVTFSFQRQLSRTHPFHPLQVYGTGNGPVLAQRQALADLVDRVEKIGDDKVRFTLRQPDSGFLAMLAMESASILSAEYAQRLADAGKRWLLDTLPVGTGPFMVAPQRTDDYLKVARKKPTKASKAKAKRHAKKGKSKAVAAPTPPARTPILELTLVAHGQHWRGAPALAAIRILATPNPVDRFVGIRAGACQIAQRPAPADLPALKKLPGVRVLEAPGSSILYLAINTANKPFDDPWVRKALARSIDREALSRVTDQPGTPATGLTRDTAGQPAADLAAARAILKGAGAQGMAIKLLVPTVTPGDPGAIALAISDAWTRAGARVALKPVSWSMLPSALAKADYDAALIGWQLDTPDAALTHQQLLSCDAVGAGNYSRWCNVEFDRLLARARAATDTAERRAIVDKARKMIAERVPVIPLLRPITLYAKGQGVENVTGADLAVYDFSKISLSPALTRRLAALDAARKEQRTAQAAKAARSKAKAKVRARAKVRAKAKRRAKQQAVAKQKAKTAATAQPHPAKPKRRSNNVFRNPPKKR